MTDTRTLRELAELMKYGPYHASKAQRDALVAAADCIDAKDRDIEELKEIRRCFGITDNSSVLSYIDKVCDEGDKAAMQLYETNARMAALTEAVQIAVNTCGDVTQIRRFASFVDPVAWVDQVQAHLEKALAEAKNDVR